MAWRVLDEAALPSLPLGRVKGALRIDHDMDDDLLRHLTQVARQYMETYSRHLLGNLRLEINLDIPAISRTPISSPWVWVPLSVGPLHTLESVALRMADGTWKQLPVRAFQADRHRLGIAIEQWMHIIEHGTELQCIGWGGVSTLSPLWDGTWLQLISLLYTSDSPDMCRVQAALKPLASLIPRRLV